MGCLIDGPVVLTATADFPELVVEWLPLNGPFDADGDWCDITHYVESGQCSRGRQYEIDRFQAGSLRLTLIATTRLFDAEHVTGPFYPYLVPMRQVRVSAVWSGTRYPVWRGYITDWGETVEQDAKFVTTIQARDAFALLERIELPSSAWALEVQKDSPILWFRLGETDTVRVTDSSEGGNYGIYDNVAQGATGLVVNDADGAVTFDVGTDQRVWVQSPTLIDDYPFTVSIMAQTSSANSDHIKTLFSGWDGFVAGIDRLNLRIDYASGPAGAGRVVSSVVGSNNTDTRSVASTIQVDDDQPHHIAVVYASASSQLVYVDGVDVTDVISAGTPTWTLGASYGFGYYIGNTPDLTVGDYGFIGTLDEVAVFDSALSAARLAAHSLAAIDGWEGDDTGTRVGRFLDAIDWPTTLRDVDTGISILGPASWSAGTSALAVLQAWADTEIGLFYTDKDGKIVWKSRHGPLLDSTSTTSQATFGDAHSAATLKFSDVAMPRDEALIRNPVRASRRDGVTVEAKDAAGITKYGNRAWSAPNSEDQLDSVIRDRAIWYRERFKEMRTRLRQMTLQPRKATGLWPQVFGREIGERITVSRTPLGLNAEVSVPQIIERVEHVFTPKSWTTVFGGSPVDPNVGDYLILDDATYGLLDTGVLAY